MSLLLSVLSSVFASAFASPSFIPAFKSADAFAQALAQFRQFLGTKHQQRNKEDDQQVHGLKQTFKHKASSRAGCRHDPAALAPVSVAQLIDASLAPCPSGADEPPNSGRLARRIRHLVIFANYFGDLSQAPTFRLFWTQGYLSRCERPIPGGPSETWFYNLVIPSLAGRFLACRTDSFRPALDNIFFWLAAGHSSARVQHLITDVNSSPAPIGRLTPNCIHALQKAGASTALIQDLTARSEDAGKAAKTAHDKPTASFGCGGAAAELAALAYSKNFKNAENKVRALLHDDPANPSLLFVLGTILERQERFDEAVDVLGESLRLKPSFSETHSQLSYVFYRTGDSDYALAEARTALSMDPTNAAAFRYLGLAHYADGHYEAALNAFQHSLELEPESADVYFDIGVTQRDKGDLRRAAIAYHHALSLRPDFWQAHTNLGVVLRDQGKLDDAIAEYRVAVRLKPDEASVRNNLGNTLCDKEDLDKAIAEFKELYRQVPDWEGGHNCLARAYMSKRDYPSAIRELQAAIAVNTRMVALPNSAFSDRPFYSPAGIRRPSKHCVRLWRLIRNRR